MTASELLNKFKGLKVLVVGDLMLDKYLWGKVERISPEAPVPVVDVYKEETRLGGAANVALNLRALGLQPILCGSIGLDNNGKEFLQLLAEQQMPNMGIVPLSNRKTTAKFRIIAQSQHILRVDKEDTQALSPQEEEQVLQKISQLLNKERIHALIFEDYDKGFLTPSLISKVLYIAQHHNIPTFVDPKFRNFHHYGGSTLFKPNLKELKKGLGDQFVGESLEDLKAKLEDIHERIGSMYLVVTLGEHGMIISGRELKHIPAHYRQIVDVSGAGDTVISVLCACMTAGLDFITSCQLANLAGGIVCEKVGVVPLPVQEWLYEATQKNYIRA